MRGFAIPLLLVVMSAASIPTVAGDLPPLRPTWELLAAGTFACLHEDTTKSIWQKRAEQRRYNLPSQKELLLLATVDP
ncbi:MAG TPA: hypothetical protein VM782_08360, partial [Stellaceae bacterium]|nr:hypothetical protein [Stellaceae bacterium]